MLSAWVGFGFASALAGFAAALQGAPPARVAAAVAAAGRTAILLPAYNEDPGLIFSAVQAMWEDLDRAGASDRYDIFVLSDTRDPRSPAPRRSPSCGFGCG